MVMPDPTKERSYIMIKPDGVQRGLISEVIGRFERRGYKLVGMKMVHPTKEMAQNHYVRNIGILRRQSCAGGCVANVLEF